MELAAEHGEAAGRVLGVDVGDCRGDVDLGGENPLEGKFDTHLKLRRRGDRAARRGCLLRGTTRTTAKDGNGSPSSENLVDLGNRLLARLDQAIAALPPEVFQLKLLNRGDCLWTA